MQKNKQKKTTNYCNSEKKQAQIEKHQIMQNYQKTYRTY